ncbi:MAG TPA: hypothetical protein VHW65_09395 [Gemmatimonadales bacterium]|nr:hypothetical protein [Gemmatimonadales bacterium]
MRCLPFAAALLLVSTPLAAQSISGRWDAGMNTPGGSIPFGLVFQLRGDTVAGTVERSAGNVPLSGIIQRDTVVFSYTIDYNGNPLTLTMTAKVFRDSLSGMVDFDGKGSDAFWATRAKPDSTHH